jgi:hypothetical protein
MPLDEYIAPTMKGLIAGDTDICTGLAEEAWNKFEKGKAEFVLQINSFLAQA